MSFSDVFMHVIVLLWGCCFLGWGRGCSFRVFFFLIVLVVVYFDQKKNCVFCIRGLFCCGGWIQGMWLFQGEGLDSNC